MSTVDRSRTDREYEHELATVRANLISMVGGVEKMIGDSVTALLGADLELARQTIEADNSINRIELETDELCLLVLAKRQPVASDLRFITWAMKMVTDLERIGDLATNISERALALKGYKPQKTAVIISEMADVNRALIQEAVEAFMHGDVELARRVFGRDEEVDRLYIQATKTIYARMNSDQTFLERGMHLQAVAKFLERIGDHISNLAELVIFMVKGKDIRHVGKLD